MDEEEAKALKEKKGREKIDFKRAEELGISLGHQKLSSVGFNNIIEDVEWIKDVKAYVTYPAYPNRQVFLIRICVCPLLPPPALQRYKITIKAPTEDAFFHWTHSFHLFNFRTFVKRHGWKLPASTGDGMKEAFEGFGDLFKDRVRECLVDPKRYTLHIEVPSPGSSMVLTFREIINNYRKVDLLTLDFTPSAWDEVIRDIRQDFERTQVHASLLKSSLVQALTLVSKRQPAILLSGAIPDPKHVNQSRPWKELVADLLPCERREDIERGEFLTDEERMLRKKIFVLLTVPKEETLDGEIDLDIGKGFDVIIVVYVKSIPVKIEGYPKAGDLSELRLTFTIFSKGPESSSPRSYLLSLTSPLDLFFNFTSSEITPDLFRLISSHINIIEPQPPQNPHDREKLLGFHRTEGVAGGVVGVIGEDLIHGYLADTDRYIVTLRLLDHQTPDPQNPSSINPPVLRKAKLEFMERVLYRTHRLLTVEFFETNREQLKAEVQDRYSRLKDDIDWTQYRLDTLFDAVRRRNPALITELANIPIPRSYTTTTATSRQKTNVPILEAPTTETPVSLRRDRATRIRQTPLYVQTNTVKPLKPVLFPVESDKEEEEYSFVGSPVREGTVLGGSPVTVRSWSPSRIPVQTERKEEGRVSPKRSMQSRRTASSPSRQRGKVSIKPSTVRVASSPIKTPAKPILESGKSEKRAAQVKARAASPKRYTTIDHTLGVKQKGGYSGSVANPPKLFPLYAGGPGGVRPWPMPVSPLFD
ncbi:hypothetical protein BC829DRAFT_429012 [Chytridium lagenaria]|nr:hypothetical protein BC829DRAFT_429012 [Chytridium lagenaria]